MKHEKLKVWLLVVLVAILAITALIQPIHATEVSNNYGDIWTYDELDVVLEETEQYIKNLNETVFANYKNKPQLAFIIINDLPYNIENYKLDMFN